MMTLVVLALMMLTYNDGVVVDDDDDDDDCDDNVGGDGDQYHTPLAVGTLLGLTTMMSQFMFVLFAVFLALAEYAETGALARNDRAMAVFSFFLFLLYVRDGQIYIIYTW